MEHYQTCPRMDHQYYVYDNPSPSSSSGIPCQNLSQYSHHTEVNQRKKMAQSPWWDPVNHVNYTSWWPQPIQSVCNMLSLEIASWWANISSEQGVHQSLDDFCWILSDILNCPTCIAKLAPLLPLAKGYHDASGLGADGVWFPAKHLVPWEMFLE